MFKKRLVAIMAVLLCAAQLLGSVPGTAFAADESAPEKYKLVLDGFDYASDDELNSVYSRNQNGGANTVSLVNADHDGATGKALQFTYTLDKAGYSGVYRSVNGYWPGLEAVTLWFKGDGQKQDILLQLSDGASYEAHLNNVEGFDSESTEWQFLTIPLKDFGRKEGTGEINLKGIQSFALYVNAVDNKQLENSVLQMDDVTLIFPEAPAMPEVTFTNTDMTASGNDNLITTLRKNTSISIGSNPAEDAWIVEASYEADDSGILDAATGMVPKGIFRKEGKTELTVKQVKVYIDDTAYTVDVDEKISVTVSDLAEPVDILEYLNSITGKDLITGMHFDGNYSDADSIHERIANEFGVYPAFYSADFLTGGTVAQRQNMIDEIIRQWNNGALVQIMFHVSPPQYTVAEESQGNWGGDTWDERKGQPNHIYSFLYEEDWEELMTDGTELNENWKARMDEYARFLQQLEDAGVTVMLRPFHEMNQHVFWWGGRTGLEGTAGLYRMFHDYMENEKGLTNIIWVWDVQDMPENYGNEKDAKFAPYVQDDGTTLLPRYDAQDIDLFNPGKEYYDILAVDFYDQGLNDPGDTLDYNHVYTEEWYKRACEVAQRDGKPMIIGETWAMISPETWESQPNWTMCMPWGNRTWTHNATGAEGMKEHYQNFLGIEETPTFATIAVPGAPEQDPKPEPEPEPADKTGVVDDFANYTDDEALRAAYVANTNGDDNDVKLVNSPFGDGGKAMEFTYNLATSGYSGAVKTLAQDWEGAEVLELWFKGDGKEQDILFQIGDGDLYSGESNTFECHLNDLKTFDKTSTEPQFLQIPLREFKAKTGGRELELTNIQSFGMYVNAVDSAQVENSKLVLGNIRVKSVGERTVVDDFSTYADDAALSAAYEANKNGDPIEVKLVDSPFGDGGKAMALTYNITKAWYSGAVRSISQSWEGASSLDFWYKGDGIKTSTITIQVCDGDRTNEANTFEVKLNDLPGFDIASTDPQYISIPLSSFKPKSGERELELTNIQTIGVYTGGEAAVTNSTITIGAIYAVGAEVSMTERRVVDDFTAYADNEAIRAAYVANSNGDPNTVEVIETPFDDGGKAMKFTYNITNAWYSGAVRSINQNWEGALTLNFWFMGDGIKTSTITIQVCDGDRTDETHTFEFKLNDLPGFDIASLGPQFISIPISSFKPKAGGNEMDLANIQTIGVYAGGSATVKDSSWTFGTIYVECLKDEYLNMESDPANIDDFESYADVAALSSVYTVDKDGGRNVLGLTRSPFEHGGRYALSMDYNTSGPGYAGVVKTVNASWEGVQSIQLAYKGNGRSGQSILLRIESGEKGNWVEANLLDLRSFNAYSSDAQYLTVSIDAFKPMTDGAELDDKNILSFAIYVKQTGGESTSGRLVFDKLNWSDVPVEDLPAAFDVQIENTVWNASGSDTFMSLLKENAKITALGEAQPETEPYILQVLYESSSDSILKNSGLYVSKGVFRGEGQIKVKILGVSVFADGMQEFLDMDQDVTVNISGLDKAVDVLDYLTEMTGKGTLSAMHNKEPNANPRSSTERLIDMVGITPAIWSGDFLYKKDDVINRQKMIDEAIRQWNDGALINIMFHVPSPLRTVEQEKGGANWTDDDGTKNSVQANLSAEEWESLLTDGGELNKNWKLRLDEYAGYLQQLKDAGVVPMVRPFHEMNQYVFWWASSEDPSRTAALYRLTKDYLVNEKGLDNMIWIWDLQDFNDRMDWERYNPGDEYWDILALDVYDGGYSDKYYAQMQEFANGKPIVVGECWRLMQPDQLTKYSDYVFAMPWADDTWTYNTPDQICAFYENTVDILKTPTFASRSEVKPGPDEPGPVDPGPTVPSVPGTPSYPVNAPDPQPENGTVTANVSRARAGETVTVTASPDSGFIVGSLTVTGSNGGRVEVQDNENGTYTFVMPSAAVTLSASFVTPGTRFKDLNDNGWYREAVAYVINRGLMNGVSEDTFNPSGTTTRGMVVTILWRLAGRPEAVDMAFGDVKESAYYFDAVKWAGTGHVIEGKAPGIFAPADNVTRQEMVTMIYRYVKSLGMDAGDTASLAGFNDADNVSSWAKEAMEWAVANGIIQGKTTVSLDPKATATRAEVATIIERVAEYIVK